MQRLEQSDWGPGDAATKEVTLAVLAHGGVRSILEGAIRETPELSAEPTLPLDVKEPIAGEATAIKIDPKAA